MAGKTIIELVQGDSYGRNIDSPDVPTFDANWVGRWAIVPALGKDPVVSGTLGKSTDATKLLLRIKPSETEDIPPGSYVLVVQVSNAVQEFRKEILQETLKIGKQGIPLP